MSYNHYFYCQWCEKQVLGAHLNQTKDFEKDKIVSNYKCLNCNRVTTTTTNLNGDVKTT